MGPCAEADRKFGNVKNALKIVHDYSDQKKYLGDAYDALSVNLRSVKYRIIFITNNG